MFLVSCLCAHLRLTIYPRYYEKYGMKKPPAKRAFCEVQRRGLSVPSSLLSQRSGCAHMIMWGGRTRRRRNLRPLSPARARPPVCLPAMAVSHHSFIGGRCVCSRKQAMKTLTPSRRQSSQKEKGKRGKFESGRSVQTTAFLRRGEPSRKAPPSSPRHCLSFSTIPHSIDPAFPLGARPPAVQISPAPSLALG